MANAGIPLGFMVVCLLVYPGLVATDSAANSTAVTTGSVQNNCSDCYVSTCTGTQSCVKECTQTCPNGYYLSTPGEPFVCAPKPSPTTTTKRTTSRTTTATTETTASTNMTMNATEHTNNNTVGHRRRRQAPDSSNNTSDTTSVAPITTPTSTAATTVIVTTPVPKHMCKLCAINVCSSCKDDANNNTICGQCSVGYQPSRDQKSCVKDEEDRLSAGAVAGIVIGVLCFITIVVVAVVCGVRYCRSRNDDGKQEQQVPSGNRELNVLAPLPKISTEEVQRQHDRVTGYTRDPTFKKTLHIAKINEESITVEEQYEISKLGPAPTPPTDDPNRRYDSLQATNQSDHEPYTSLEGADESIYVNVATTAKEHNRNKSANTQAANSSKAAYSNIPETPDKITKKTMSEGSVEIYEPVENGQDHEEPQELYMNNRSIKAGHGSYAEDEGGEEIYVNDKENSTEEVYEVV